MATELPETRRGFDRCLARQIWNAIYRSARCRRTCGKYQASRHAVVEWALGEFQRRIQAIRETPTHHAAKALLLRQELALIPTMSRTNRINGHGQEARVNGKHRGGSLSFSEHRIDAGYVILS